MIILKKAGRALGKSFRRKRVWIPLLILALVYVNNSSLLAKPGTGTPSLLAHRGLAQTFDLDGVKWDTCTAERIHKPEHPYLENTIPSMRAAFKAGADMVELDVQLTKDNQFAVFHDHMLECRTEARGKIRDYTMAELRKLDVGYGYTADGGKTYPFRGKGTGLMPSLDEVLQAFPDRQLLLHVKSDDPVEGIMLARQLERLPADRLKRLAVYGGDQPVKALEERIPELRTMSNESIKKCLLSYIAAGWTGYVPAACKNTQLHIPDEIGPWLWGWPNRFLNRMDGAGTRVVIVKGKGGFSEGFDTAGDLSRLPDGYDKWIWTNRIDRIAPLFDSD
ncbi:MAG: glycerophosphodiester phosphodiesterase family protein [Thermoactinomyces sp.]